MSSLENQPIPVRPTETSGHSLMDKLHGRLRSLGEQVAQKLESGEPRPDVAAVLGSVREDDWDQFKKTVESQLEDMHVELWSHVEQQLAAFRSDLVNEMSIACERLTEELKARVRTHSAASELRAIVAATAAVKGGTSPVRPNTDDGGCIAEGDAAYGQTFAIGLAAELHAARTERDDILTRLVTLEARIARQSPEAALSHLATFATEPSMASGSWRRPAAPAGLIAGETKNTTPRTDPSVMPLTSKASVDYGRHIQDICDGRSKGNTKRGNRSSANMR